MKIIIIGGVAGGATTAARIRRTNEAAEIILLEKGKYISYANCGLPYYIGGVIKEREKLFVQTPEAFSTRFRVDVRTENEVIFIDRKRKTVTVRQSSGDTYEESYDKLLDRIFDEATVFKLRGESFRRKKLDTVSVQTGKVKAVEPMADQQE